MIIQESIYSYSRRIKMLSDTLSNLVKLNHGKYGQYHLCSSIFNIAHVLNQFVFEK